MDDFEKLLQKKSFKKPSVLYKEAPQPIETPYKPQDVIESVYSQMKAIHLADSSRGAKGNTGSINAKKSNFLRVNKLPVYCEVPKLNTNKFETQCVSDTQLINIIEGAEAIEAHTGMTQEFDMSFAHVEDKNRDKPEHYEPNDCIINRKDKSIPSFSYVNLNSPYQRDSNSNKCCKSNENTFNDTANSQIIKVPFGEERNKIKDISCRDTSQNLKDTEATFFSDSLMTQDIHSQSLKTDKEDTATFIENISFSQENKQAINVFNSEQTNVCNELKNMTFNENDNDIIGAEEINVDTGQCSHRSPSPVLKSKIIKRITRTPSPLVVPLESFENFEQIAMSVIEEAGEMDPAKHVINSQILGKELLFNTNADIIFADRNFSPILELKSDELQMNSQILKTPIKNILDNAVSLQDDNCEKRSDSLKDEILFSSDEENYYIHKELQDLPLTCALESSFYDGPDVLEKTMYVGFQTASSKSIQICTASFDKAKTILDEDYAKSGSEFSLTELVEKCDVLNSNFQKSDSDKPGAIDFKTINVEREVDSNSNPVKSTDTLQTKSDIITERKRSIEQKIELKISQNIGYENACKEYPNKRLFKGFKTANLKNIKTSETSMKICQVFKDIDLNENFCTTEDLALKNSDVKNDSYTKENKDNCRQIETIRIEDKINDELLIKEFENIEMSLEAKYTCDEEKTSIAIKSSNNIAKNTREIQLIESLKSQPIETRTGVHNPGSVNVMGFKTASNKNINVSPEALAKTKTIFQDIDISKDANITDCFKKPSSNDTHFVGFRTANNKDIKISEAAFAKSKSIFGEEDIDKNFTMDTIDDINQPSTSKAVFVITSNNKAVKVSEEAKSESEHIFKDIDSENSDMETIVDINQPSTSKTVFEGFKTANNKQIRISTEALSNSKTMFKDIEKEYSATEPIYSKELLETNVDKKMQNVRLTIDIMPSNNTNKQIKSDYSKNNFTESCIQTSKSEFMNIGFKTANNKDINISDEAFSKSKRIFEDIDKKTIANEISKDVDNPRTSTVQLGKMIKANNTYDERDDLSKDKNVSKVFDAKSSTEDKIEDIYQPSTSEAVFVGFKTANNKDIKISDIGLIKSKNIFKDIDKEDLSLSEIKSKQAAFQGFKTASNKNVNISSQALAKTKQMFKSIESNDSIHIPEIAPIIQAQNIGFKTANNNPVNISAESIAKSKKLFEDIVSEDLDSESRLCDKGNSGENQLFQGFQTATNKPVSVSEDAIKRSKRVFQDIDANEEVPEKIPKTNFKGFQTANRKPVEINEDALTASKKLFSDVKDEEINPNSFVGFKTASNKNVNISEEALAKCKNIFNDIEGSPQDQTDSATTKENLLKAFQTASIKEVEKSKQSLEKSTNVFDDINNFDKKENMSFGFQTASNKQASVSEKALAHTRKLFKDTEKACADGLIKDTNDAVEFKTCNNKKIKVSEDAFIKSKNILAEQVTLDKTGNSGNSLQMKSKNNKDFIVEKKDDSINLDCLINTQVLNNFEENMCTEDFNGSPKSNKRSASPILSCPRAKKRKKFETPYKSIPKTVIDFTKTEVKKVSHLLEFKEKIKRDKTYSLKSLLSVEKDGTDSVPIDPIIANLNLESILNFEFDKERNNLTQGKITIEEIKQHFTEATDKKLVPDGWLDIQLKLILWKLISYEIEFPKTLGRVCTVRNVIDQLKYRYDKELYNAERPILRKILEKDDVSTRTMVLCVAGIIVDGVNVTSATTLTNIELLLTDGWYFIKATIDKMLSKLVYDGKIAVGCKIAICGAELVGNEQGVAPWEDTTSIRLQISGNSTRRARWDARLGLRAGAILCRLCDVTADGGRASRVQALVYRRYPPLYLEKCPDGSTVTRSERLELQYQMKYEVEREAMLERIYEEVEKEFQASQESDGLSDPSRWYESGSQIARLMKKSKDPTEFRAQLTTTQAYLLQEYNCKQRDAYLRAVQCRIQEKMRTRNVVPIVRGKLASLSQDGKISKATLSVWKPSDEVLDIFKEGAWVEVLNVVPTAMRNSEIQLSAGRQSAFRRLKTKENQTFEQFETLKRTCNTIDHLSQNPTMATPCNEIDTAGVVFLIDPPNAEFESTKSQFQNLYLADFEKNIICVNFWGGIKKFGYENVLETGQVIYCENLQKRAGNSRKNIPQYRATEYTFFTKTPKNEKGRNIVDDLNKKLGIDRRKFCDDCGAVKQNYSVIRCFSDGENVTPYRFNKSDYNLNKNKMFIDTPVGVKVLKQDDFNLTGLDFESSFKLDTQEHSPATLMRKKKVNEKIARLKMYGEPPPLSTINIINKSKSTANSYKSPLISKNGAETTNKISVASVNNECDRSDSDGTTNLLGSPIISINRTFVKRCVNPVKLNFSETAAIDENDKTGDQFAEEFDGSPPLSLD